MAWVSWQRSVFEPSRRAENVSSALIYAHKALAADPNDYLTILTLGTIAAEARDFRSALSHVERALSVAPVSGPTTGIAGDLTMVCGYPAEGVALMRKAIRYEPDPPLWLLASLSVGLRMLDRYAEARAVAEELLEASAENSRHRGYALGELAVVAAHEGDVKAARDYVSRWVEVDPRSANIFDVKRRFSKFKDQAFAAETIGFLRQSGLPEEARVKS